jgi:predicted porin
MRTTALLAALCCCPALASADTGASASVYGLIDAYGASARTSVNGVSQGRSTLVQSGGMTTSFWGIKGSEQLGGGTSVVFALESFFRGDTGEQGRNGTDSLFARNAYVGLDGRYGRLTVGRQSSLLYIAAGAFNPFGTSTPFSPTIMQVYRPFGTIYASAPLAGDTAWSNAVRYSAPEVGGLRADLMVEASEGSSGADRKRNRASAGTLTYLRGKLGMVAGYQRMHLDQNADGHVQDALHVGASYDAGVIKPFLQWYRIRDRFDALPNGRHRIGLAGATVPVPGGSVLASYGRTLTDGSGRPDARRESWALAYDYVLSKRSDVYASVKRDRVEPSRTEDLLGLGIRHKF